MSAERPLCKCHGEPMLWNRDRRKKAGGFWHCRVKRREARRRYYEANQEKWSEYWRRPEILLRRRIRKRNLATERERAYVLQWLEKHPDLKEVAAQYGFTP